MSVPEIKSYIRNATKEYNDRKASYGHKKESGWKGNYAFDVAMRSTESKIGTKKSGDLALKFTGKHKSDLLVQARQLQNALRVDVFSPMAEDDFEQKRYNAYKQFKRTTGQNITYNDYIDMVNSVGTISNTILREFGSGEVFKLYKKYVRNKSGKVNEFDFTSAIYKIHKESKGKGRSTTEMYDLLVDELRSAQESAKAAERLARKKK